uniref:G-protein coupled receptors family 1 profile domain-containing protein n=1 Tax=Pseudo-nitzschia arenysensis TaxID=697910 RepID=A0A7R9ZUG6_9STRA|mmetsp:Transcript_79/g.199  ORF Transcript_79/g.199 Transcript_79/m.199 type:complete len:355 (+) Transcript_79:123-1187(+)
MSSNMDSTSSMALMLADSIVYKVLIVTVLSIASIAVIVSAILLVAMTLPLLIPRQRKKYSTYNLYLAYLSIPDLVAYSYIVHLILTRHDADFHPKTDKDGAVQWMFEDNRFDHNVYAMCVASNLYTNAFLIHECYLLLKDSANTRRHAPPTVKRVTQQALVAYGMGIFAFVMEFFLSDILEGEEKNIRIWFGLYQALSFTIFVTIPLSVLLILWVTIHKEGLVRSTGSMYDGRLKVLVSYFVRIVVSYLSLWMPATISYMVYWSTREITPTKVIAYFIFLLLSGSQATLNFILSLTKPDARKFVVNLLVCEYCFKPHEKTEEDEDTTSSTILHDPYLGLDEAVELTSRHLALTA